MSRFKLAARFNISEQLTLEFIWDLEFIFKIRITGKKKDCKKNRITAYKAEKYNRGGQMTNIMNPRHAVMVADDREDTLMIVKEMLLWPQTLQGCFPRV